MNIGGHLQLVWWGWTSWHLGRWQFPRKGMVLADGTNAGVIFRGYVIGPLEIRIWPKAMPSAQKPNVVAVSDSSQLKGDGA